MTQEQISNLFQLLIILGGVFMAVMGVAVNYLRLLIKDSKTSTIQIVRDLLDDKYLTLREADARYVVRHDNN